MQQAAFIRRDIKAGLSAGLQVGEENRKRVVGNKIENQGVLVLILLSIMTTTRGEEGVKGFEENGKKSLGIRKRKEN